MNISQENTDIKSLMRNPFTVKSPEELSQYQIVQLFVSRYTKIETIKERKHTFIWGSRGSGKSMMLRYLEPRCKAIIHGSLNDFLQKEDSFVGVYCPCKEGQLNKTDFQIFDDKVQLIISEHLFNLTIAKHTLQCFFDQFPKDYFRKEKIEGFVKQVMALFDKASVSSSAYDANDLADRTDDPLNWLNVFFQQEISKISRFLRAQVLDKNPPHYDGTTTGYHDFLLPFVRLVRRFLLRTATPIYVLVDDADHLLPFQQKIVNTWMANRDQLKLCFKVSSRREGYHSFVTRDGVKIDEPHDYSTVDVDELYTTSKSDYASKVTLIANKRLELSDVPTKNIEAFLPPDHRQARMLSQIKKETAEEWKKAGRPGRQNDYVTRLATARLFQKLGKEKQRRNYAGFKNIVDLSSGVVRDFLEPCYLMFSRLLEQGQQPSDINSVPAAIQSNVLFRYSETFLVHGFDEIKKKTPTEKWEQLSILETLVSSLGKLFYERLHNPEAKEARLFSFTVRGLIPSDLDDILTLGVQHRYFQLRSYSTKEGGGREKWYILNRRLCPVFKLDPSGFEGRISLTVDKLRIACQNPDQFVRLRLKRSSETAGDQTSFCLEER